MSLTTFQTSFTLLASSIFRLFREQTNLNSKTKQLMENLKVKPVNLASKSLLVTALLQKNPGQFIYAVGAWRKMQLKIEQLKLKMWSWRFFKRLYHFNMKQFSLSSREADNLTRFRGEINVEICLGIKRQYFGKSVLVCLSLF